MTNTILAGHAQKLRVERNKLEKYQHDKINQELLKAANMLNLPAYERFKSRLKRRESVPEHIVFSLRNPDAPPHIFRSSIDRCDCVDKKEDDKMCGHEIKWKDGKFVKEMFHERHFHRDECEGSVTGWFPPTQSEYENSIGIYDKKFIENSIRGNGEDEYDEIEVDVHNLDEKTPDSFQEKPLGYIIEKEVKVKPLDNTRIREMLSKASVLYGSCDEETRFAISALAIRIEELSVHGNKCSPNNVTREMKDRCTSSRGIINQTIKDIISSYNKTYNATHDVSHAKIIQPSAMQLKRESKLRKKP